MKTSLRISFLLLTSVCFGQKLSFEGDLIDTVIIMSHVSAYQFDDNGTTVGKSEGLCIAFDSTSGKYKASSRYKESFKVTRHPEKIITKKKPIKLNSDEQVSGSDLELLFRSLSSNHNPVNLLEEPNIQLVQSLLTEKRIRKVARRKRVSWNFGPRYSTKQENQAFFKSCQSLDTMKIYLTERFDSVGYVMITDYANTINIWVRSENEQFMFEGKYPNPVKQPWYYVSDTTTFENKAILNLDINLAIEKILPAKFLLSQSISMEAIVEDYISWFLETHGMKY